MAAMYEIRANYDNNTIVMYQAYNDAIADAAIKAQCFVSPFSTRRMTWFKPSFRWLMHRSNWGKKSGQNRILAVHIHREAWEDALSRGVLTHPEPSIHGSREAWREKFEAASVHVQWDPERSLQGGALDHYSIQVGLTRHLIEEFASSWITRIEDLSPLVAKMEQMRQGKGKKHLSRHLPPERVYPLPEGFGAHLLM